MATNVSFKLTHDGIVLSFQPIFEAMIYFVSPRSGMRPRYRKVMIISGALFVFSLVVASALSFLAFEAPANIDRPPTPSESSRNFMLVAVVSMFTSLGSAVAFVSTFILSWTRESRERAMFRIDAEKKKLENEKLTLELEQMRKNRDA